MCGEVKAGVPGTGLMAYLAFMPDVPQQREVLGGEVPKGFDLPAMHEGNQVEVIQLQRETQRMVTTGLLLTRKGQFHPKR